MGKVMRPFCWHQNFVPWGLSAPALGLYTYIKSWKKNCIKSDFKETFLKLATNDQSDKMFCWHKNFVPKGLSAPALGLYTCIKSWKKLYKIRLHRDFFETCNKWLKWQDISVDIKILSPGVCLPLPRGYIHVLNHEKNLHKIRLQRYFFETCNKWMKWQDISVDIKLCPLGAVCACPRAIYMCKIMKKII